MVKSLGEVDELVGDDEVPGGVVLLQGSDGAGGDDVLASQLLQRPHVGPVGDVGRGVLVLLAVAVEERDLHAVDPADEYGVGGFAVRGVGEDLFDHLEGVRVVDSGASYDSYLGHVRFIVTLIII